MNNRILDIEDNDMIDSLWYRVYGRWYIDHVSCGMLCLGIPFLPAFLLSSLPKAPLLPGASGEPHKNFTVFRLYCIMLFHIIPYCIILFRIICIILFHIVPYCIIRFHTVPDCIVVFHIVPDCIILHCTYHVIFRMLSYCILLFDPFLCARRDWVALPQSGSPHKARWRLVEDGWDRGLRHLD